MDIRIARVAKNSCKSERPFEHGETIVSAVRVIEQEYQREDYSKADWTDHEAKTAVAVWNTTYVDPAIAEQEPDETFSPLRKLFYEATEDESRVERAKTYLAAELLRRQKVFRLLKQGDDPEEGGRICLYRDRIGDRMVEVRDPGLTYQELEEGRTALVERLLELEAPPEPEVAEEDTDEVEETTDEAVDEEEEFDSDDEDDEFVDEDDEEAWFEDDDEEEDEA